MFSFFKRKPKYFDFPVEVDMHSHLIPGLDDGVKSLDETIHILEIFQQLGYKKVITTPHIMSDHYQNTEQDIKNKQVEINEFLINHNLEIQFEAAAEYYLDEGFMAKLSEQQKLLTFGENYLLFETSFINKPAFLEDAVFKMNALGYLPILAHPERYSYLIGNNVLINKLKDMNVLFQMNLLSLTGFYSSDIKRHATKLLKEKQIDFVGSDCHNAFQANEISTSINGKHIKLLESQNLLNNTLLKN